MRLLSIIVNYRTADLTLQSLEALLRETEAIQPSQVMVVDNDSQDGSFEKIRDAVAAKGLGERVEVLASGHNGGFGFGNNLALRRALAKTEPPEYFYLLNSDAFPDPGAIETLLRFLDGEPQAGIAGSYVHGPDGTPHETAFRFPSIASEVERGFRFGPVSRLLERWIVPLPIPTETTEVDWLAGASMMIRRSTLETIGLFDESFFLYFEETDLCRRAKDAGFSTYYVPASSIAHIGSASTGLKDRSKRTPPYWFASRRHYFQKNHGAAYLHGANLGWMMSFSLWRIRRRLQGKPDPDPPRALRDFIVQNFAR